MKWEMWFLFLRATVNNYIINQNSQFRVCGMKTALK